MIPFTIFLVVYSLIMSYVAINLSGKLKLPPKKGEELPEEQFIKDISKATGKKIGEDYGFICGTKHPSMEKTTNRGMYSANCQDGFEVWKKIMKPTYEKKLLNPNSYDESLEQIVKFLNNEEV